MKVSFGLFLVIHEIMNLQRKKQLFNFVASEAFTKCIKELFGCNKEQHVPLVNIIVV